jgi:hypothetical protein
MSSLGTSKGVLEIAKFGVYVSVPVVLTYLVATDSKTLKKLMGLVSPFSPPLPSPPLPCLPLSLPESSSLCSRGGIRIIKRGSELIGICGSAVLVPNSWGR